MKPRTQARERSVTESLKLRRFIEQSERRASSRLGSSVPRRQIQVFERANRPPRETSKLQITWPRGVGALDTLMYAPSSHLGLVAVPAVYPHPLEDHGYRADLPTIVLRWCGILRSWLAPAGIS